MSSLLEIRDLKVNYGGIEALKGVSFDVKEGEIVTLIGANGAGKSTLFNAIAGSFITDSGSISLDGKDITLMPEHKRAKSIGRLFQDPMRGSAPGSARTCVSRERKWTLDRSSILRMRLAHWLSGRLREESRLSMSNRSSASVNARSMYQPVQKVPSSPSAPARGRSSQQTG